MIEHLLQDPGYRSAREAGSWWVWPAPCAIEPPSWEQLLENLAFSSQRQGELGLLANLGFVGYHANRIPIVGTIRRELQTECPDTETSAHLFVSMGQQSGGYGRHKDDNDLWFWQMYGSTDWRVEHPSGDYVGTLGPGSWIYVHRELYHTVRPQGARACISFANHYLIPKNSIKLF
jgi:hypothetical protein